MANKSLLAANRFAPNGSCHYHDVKLTTDRNTSGPQVTRFTSLYLANPFLLVTDFMADELVLTAAERAALRTFKQYLATPEQMICFFGPTLQKHGTALDKLTKKDLLVKENFKGAWSLTVAGYEAMKTCSEET